MRIGIIGSGNIGGTLASHLAKLGHQVSIANSRGPESLTSFASEIGAKASSVSDVTQGADVIIVSIPEKAIPNLPKGLFANIPSHVPVIDTGNYYPELRDGRIEAIDQGMLDSKWVEQHIGHPVIKAFNNIYAESLRKKGAVRGTSGRIALSVAGDSLENKKIVLGLIDDLGFDPVDGGDLANSWRQQPGMPSYCQDLQATALKRALSEADHDRIADCRAQQEQHTRKLMTSNRQDIAPEHTAVRVALWRALHVQIDPKPHVLVDEIGAKLVAEENWQSRPDMDPDFSKGMRASITGRARLIEDLLEEQIKLGVVQYVILGAGLDTFAQRRPDLGSHLHIFEVDQPGPQAWKQKRLAEIGFVIPEWLHFVPVDFEAGQSWWKQLLAAGFDPSKPTVVVSTGVSMYLTKETNMATLQQMAKLAPGSTFAMTFMLALDLLEPQEKGLLEFVMKRAGESGTPFLSLFTPTEILAMAKTAGFKSAQYISGEDLYQRYFAKRTDGLKAGNAEAFLVATT